MSAIRWTRSHGATLAAAAVCVAAVTILIVRLAGGDAPSSAATAPESIRASAARGSVDPAAERRRSTRLRIATAPDGANPALYVRDDHHAKVRTAPNGGSVAADVGSHTAWGSRTTLAVAGVDGRWARVLTSEMPNGDLGWVKLDRRRLGSYYTPDSIDVDLSARTVTVTRDGEPVRSFRVSVGAPGTDTPTGRFAVTDTFRGLQNPSYGCCALALTAHQPNLPTGWLGGNRIAIHGTSDPVGYAVSHGCIRAADDDVRWLVAHVLIGSLVDVHE